MAVHVESVAVRMRWPYRQHHLPTGVVTIAIASPPASLAVSYRTVPAQHGSVSICPGIAVVEHRGRAGKVVCVIPTTGHVLVYHSNSVPVLLRVLI